MKTLAILFCAALAGAVAAQEAAAAPASPTPSLDEKNMIVAKVDKAIITRRDVEREIWEVLVALQQDPLKSPAEKEAEYAYHFKTKLSEMIGQELTVQLGRAAGIEVPEEYVEVQVREKAEELEGLPALIGVLGDRGMTLDDLREKIEEDAMMREVLLGTTGLKQAEGLDIPPLDTYVTPKEVWEYYQQNQDKFRTEAAIKISLIMVSGKAPRGARKAQTRAEEVLRRARAGESFTALVAEFSDNPSTKKDAGRMAGGEWISASSDELREEFAEVVWGLPRGGISDIVTVGTNYFIFRIDDKQEASVPTFAEIQDRIKARLQQQRLQENFRRVEGKLRQKAYIWPENIGGSPEGQ